MVWEIFRKKEIIFTSKKYPKLNPDKKRFKVISADKKKKAKILAKAVEGFINLYSKSSKSRQRYKNNKIWREQNAAIKEMRVRKAKKKAILKPKKTIRRKLKHKPMRAVVKQKLLKLKRASRKPVIVKKKAIVIKPVKQKLAKNTDEKQIGVITHFFTNVNAAVIKLKAPLVVGELIHIKGNSTDFTQTAGSMQINRKPIEQAKKGDEIGLLVKEKVKVGDIVYRIG